MKKFNFRAFVPVYFTVFLCCLLITWIGSNSATVMSEASVLENRTTVLIDAGHGGVDGGATSCAGVLESKINLEIALRLDDLMHLLGYQTQMIRTTDRSMHTQGETIAAQKVSDLKERVRTVNNTENALLVSIHQNYYSDGKYSGAQVFYGNAGASRELAEQLQSSLIKLLNPNSKRTSKKATGIYLMEHITCTGILIECGFLSNAQEEAKLRSPDYQKQLCCVVAGSISKHLDRDRIS